MDTFAGRIVIVSGPPCAGKGTQCKRIAEKLGLVHISTGDIFRDHAQRGTELGSMAAEYMNQGSFVPDQVVINHVLDRMRQPDAVQQGCLLDGFPRTVEQAETLVSKFEVDHFIMLQVPDKVLKKRAPERRIDPETGEIYHLSYVVPPVEKLPKLVIRPYDTDEHAFCTRLTVYHGQIRRILPYFSGKVRRVDGLREPDEVFSSVEAVLNDVPRVSSEGGDTVHNVLECSVCFASPADHLVIPCGHQCGCEECLSTVQRTSGLCPICRTRVTGIQRVFQCGREAGGHAEAAVPTQIPSKRDIEAVRDSDAMEEDDEWPEDPEPETGARQAVSLNVAPDKDVEHGGDAKVMVSIQVPQGQVRVPADICCVVDVSGSMGSRAKYEDENGNMKDDGLSILDIVKHAVKTVMHTMKDEDRLSLVTFSSAAVTIFELKAMTADGRKQAELELERLHPGGQTNLWGGILAGMETLLAPSSTRRQKTLLLLTDGQPNISPPRGHISELRDYKDAHPELSFQINTFGFGYSLDSQLLLDLALEGNGTYAFIPDALIVGTVFVNSIANAISTHTQNATLHLTVCGEAKFTGPVVGSLHVTETSWGRVVALGPLQFGQSREVVVPMNIPEGTGSYLEATLTYHTLDGAEARVPIVASSRTCSQDAVVAACRCETVTVGYAAIEDACANKGKQAQNAVRDLTSNISHHQLDLVDGRLVALRADVEGRMSKALQGKERFNRWGKHYLRALMRSHQLQLCTNFMDPGLQVYGGDLFKRLREEGDAVFISLPPPKPTGTAGRASPQFAPPSRTATRNNARSRSPSPDMRTYYAGAGGGCFGEASSVIVVRPNEGDVRIPVAKIRPGDKLRVAEGVARVRCVVRITRSPAKGLVTLPGGLAITPRHPVRVDGRWRLPRDLGTPITNPSGCVYNFVLDRCHVLLVDGIECVTWGHNFQGDVVGHPYYGSRRVIDELSKTPGWENGMVQIEGCFRDSTGQVVGLRALNASTEQTPRVREPILGGLAAVTMPGFEHNAVKTRGCTHDAGHATGIEAAANKANGLGGVYLAALMMQHIVGDLFGSILNYLAGDPMRIAGRQMSST
eukprot:gnl/TRDRNA2_/TRDRNA2_184047_c0_seq1.p1 gnl/TRDRNA2_/TRDRNA2_184047_c0~~gnl/TRDRNA2_/TRDRNA2_184047_c0_seq1.p1  ORF type:complete len:1086 (+),score=163.33 gnl/TRDRNA2_/TRDRNA2_184047_c0_seq1:79-3336(+)